jgi:hypothetical protein
MLILHRLSVAAALIVLAGGARRARAQDPAEGQFTSIGTYAVSIPIGDTHRFVPVMSWFGVGWEGQWALRPRTNWGGSATINDFFDATDGTRTFPQGAATGLQNLDLLMVSAMGNIHHFVGKSSSHGPFIGLGAGIQYAQQYYQVGINSQFSRSAWHFVVAPDAGFTSHVMDGVDFVFSARLVSPTSTGDYLGGGSRSFRFIAFSFGLAER